MNHSARNNITAPNFMRSAMAPTISAGVMAAKVSWKMTKVSSGISTPAENVAAVVEGVTPARKSLEKSPMKAESPPSVGPLKANV